MNNYQFPSDTLVKTYQHDCVMQPFVSMHAVLTDDKFKQENTMALPVALGYTLAGQVFMFDLAETNVLIGGACGFGKTTAIRALIVSLLYKKRPDELKFILMDPKVCDAALFKSLGVHYLAAMEGTDSGKSIINDCDDAIKVLNALQQEQKNRFRLFMEAGVRNIVEYNEKFKEGVLDPSKEIEDGLKHHHLPYIVTIIDEYDDYMIQTKHKFDRYITRVAQLSKAVGMPVVISTQRPAVSVVTGIIKVNFNTRIAFRTASTYDSRAICDIGDALYLVHRGEFYYVDSNNVEHAQCAYVEGGEIEAIVSHISSQNYIGTRYELPIANEDVCVGE